MANNRGRRSSQQGNFDWGDNFPVKAIRRELDPRSLAIVGSITARAQAIIGDSCVPLLDEARGVTLLTISTIGRVRKARGSKESFDATRSRIMRRAQGIGDVALGDDINANIMSFGTPRSTLTEGADHRVLLVNLSGDEINEEQQALVRVAHDLGLKGGIRAQPHITAAQLNHSPLILDQQYVGLRSQLRQEFEGQQLTLLGIE